ncbi:hypothetical protein C8F04DRAFT_1107911 [Mycena alexandri]|uniref:Uncharacterized protein n=1 Tax=Mycena alexandri TaxID=1745969 RepID=A0AAD6X4Z3_9AGAR|nr:hypothetical protein C8F04DRAFT_1107911 [Mycena alexandri]
MIPHACTTPARAGTRYPLRLLSRGVPVAPLPGRRCEYREECACDDGDGACKEDSRELRRYIHRPAALNIAPRGSPHADPPLPATPPPVPRPKVYRARHRIHFPIRIHTASSAPASRTRTPSTNALSTSALSAPSTSQRPGSTPISTSTSATQYSARTPDKQKPQQRNAPPAAANIVALLFSFSSATSFSTPGKRTRCPRPGVPLGRQAR